MRLRNRAIAFAVTMILVWNNAMAPVSLAYADTNALFGGLVAPSQSIARVAATSALGFANPVAPPQVQGADSSISVSGSNAQADALVESLAEAPAPEAADDNETAAEESADKTAGKAVPAADAPAGDSDAPAPADEPDASASDQSPAYATELTKKLKSVDGRTYVVRIKADDAAAIPADATLEVVELTKAPTASEKRKNPDAYKDRPTATERMLNTDEQKARADALAKALSTKEDDEVIWSKYLDVKIKATDGKEVTPAAAVTVEVESNAVTPQSAPALEAALVSGEPKALEASERTSRIETYTDAEGKERERAWSKVTLSADRLGELAVAVVAAPVRTWQLRAGNVALLGPRVGVNAWADDAEAAAPEGTELQPEAAFVAMATPAENVPDATAGRGIQLWVRATAAPEATGGIAVWHSDANGASVQLLAAGEQGPAAIMAGERVDLLWDQLFERQTLTAGDVTLEGALPQGAEATAADLTSELADPTKLEGDAPQAQPGEELKTVAAYSIALEVGNEEYAPDEAHPVEATVATDAVAKADPETLEVWRVDGTQATPVDADATDDAVSFDATAMGTYIVVERKSITKTIVASDNNTYIITATFGPDAMLPTNADLQVRELTDDERAPYEASATEAVGGGRLEYMRAFDITIVDAEGNDLEPAAPVEVSIALSDGEAPKDAGVVHFADDEDKTAELMDARAKSYHDKTVSYTFAADSFSVYAVTYTVDFHWNGYTYNLAGGSEMLLSQLFEILKAATQYGADGELNPEQFDISIEDVSEVRFSDPELLEISKIEGTEQIQALADYIAENSAASENEAMDEAWLDEEEEKQAEGYHPIESASDADENPDDAVPANAVPALTVTWDADWLLTSLAPFTSDEALTLTLKDGRTLDIHVTDAVSFNYQGLAYQTINNNTTNVKVVGYQSNYSGVPTIPATISYNGTTYTVTDLTYFGTARTLKNKNLFFETGMLDKMANNAVIGMPEMVAQMDAAVEQSLLDQGFMPGAQNGTADQLIFKKAVYSPETNSITYEIRYFQPMKQNQPLDFIFGIDQSGTMCTHDATANGIRAPRVIWMMALLQRTAYELVSKNGQGYDNKVAFVPWGSEKVTPVTNEDFLGNATQIDAWFQGPKPYSHAAEGTSHGKACDALADAAALSIRKGRTPIVIYMSDFVSFAGSNRTQRDRLKLAKFKTYSFVVFNGPHTDFSENWSNSGAYASDEPAEFMGIFRNIVLDAIGYYMKGNIAVTDTMPGAIADVTATQTKADGTAAENPGSVSPSAGKVTWQLGNQNPLLGSGKVHSETFTAKLDDDTIYSGAMPTNGKVTVTVNGKEVNSITPKPNDPDHLHRGGDVVFLLGRLDKKAQISTDNKGVPTTLTEGIRFTLKRVGESETIKTEASPDGLFTTDGNGSFAVPYKDKDGKVIFGLGERFVLHEDADSVSDYNEEDAHDEKLVAPDKDWIITVSESGIITMAAESAAGQTPPPTVADADNPNPPRLVIWNQIVVEATLIPVTVQKVWPDNDHPHDPVPFTVYGVDPNKTYEERELTAYDGKNVASAKQLKYIAPGNVGFTQSADGLTWTQVVYVPDSETTDSGSYQYYDDKIMSAENTHNYHVNQQAADLGEYDAMDGETDGNITYAQQYSYIVREGDLIYPYGWYTPAYNNNVSESKRTNTALAVDGGTANFVAYDNGTGSTTVAEQTVTGGTGTLDGKNLRQNFQFHIAMGHFEYWDSELSYDDLEQYFGFSFSNHEKTHNAVKDLGSRDEVRNFFTHIGEITVEFSKADGDVTKNYTLKFKPDVGNYKLEDNDIAAPAAHDAYTFRGIALPSDWADDYTAVKRDINTRTWFRALNGITYKKITMTSNVDSSKKIIVYSNNSTDTDNKLYWNWTKYDQLGDRPELEVMVSGERYHRISTSNLSQSLTRKEYTSSGTDPKPLTDNQYNRNVVIYAPPVLDITNHWTPNPLVEVKVTKNWMNDDSGTPQPYGEDIYNVKQDVSFLLKGTTTAGGTKDVPIFDSDDAGWYNGTSSGSDKATIAKTADNKDSATWEKSFYVPTYDVLGTYDPETRTCEAYTFDDSSLTEVGLDVARDEDGEPKGAWSNDESFTEGGTTVTPGVHHNAGYYTIESDEYDNYPRKAYVKFVASDDLEYVTLSSVKITFHSKRTGKKYQLVLNVKNPPSVRRGSTYLIIFRTDDFGANFIADEVLANGTSSQNLRHTEFYTKDPSTNLNVFVLESNSSLPPVQEWREAWDEPETITHSDTTFTLTNTYTPYKEVNLTSAFTDGTDDRESIKNISGVVYTVKQGGTVVRTARTTAPGTTTDGNPVVRGLSKTVYLPKGSYTIEQTGYTLTGEEQVYPTVAFTTEGGTTRSLNIQSDTDVAYNNTRKNLPIEVKMAWDPTLAADEDPLQQSGKTLPYAIYVDVPGDDEENDYRRSGSYTRKVNGASESINGKYQMEYARQENRHGAGIPSYSIRGEQTQCSLDRSDMENALPDYTLEVLTEETAQKLVFTIQATIRKADIRLYKIWEDVSGDFAYPASLTFTLKRSDDENICGTTEAVKTITITNPGDPEAWQGKFEDIPVLRGFGADASAKYILTETDDDFSRNAFGKYYTTYEDESGLSENAFESLRPKDGDGHTVEYAAFRLRDGGIFIDVRNAEGPYICKIVEHYGTADAPIDVEVPFRSLNKAITHARTNMIMDAENSVTIQMLSDYEMPSDDRVLLDQEDDNFIFTTAATSGNEKYLYAPAEGATEENGRLTSATITRAYTGDSLFAQSAANELTFTNIILDGNKNADDPDNEGNYTATGDGGLVSTYAGTLNLRDGAVLQNSYSDGRGGAVRVVGGIFDMSGTAKVLNSVGEHGGGIHLGESGAPTTATISGGTVAGCEARQWGGGIFLHGAGTKLELSGGTITNNTTRESGNGGGVFIEEGSKLELSGEPKFTGSYTNEDGETVGGTGNYVPTGESDDEGNALTRRQDIYIAGYLSKTEGDETVAQNATSLVIKDTLNVEKGAIWVDAQRAPDDESNHHDQNKQFAVFDDSLMNTDDEGSKTVKLAEADLLKTLQAFRNAYTDDEFYGATGDDPTCIYWDGIKGTRRVALRKIETGTYASIGGAVFDVYKTSNLSKPVVVKHEGAGDEALSGLTSRDKSGIFWIGELPYGAYVVQETTVPADYVQSQRYFWFVVDEEGVEMAAAGMDDRAAAKTAADVLFKARKTARG